MDTPPNTLRLSLDGAVELVASEDWRNQVYPDIEGNKTIGVGHLLTRSEQTSGKITIRGVSCKWASGLTDLQVMLLLAQDVASREAVINSAVKVPLTQNQFDALLLFVFNIGRTAFANSTLLRLLNLGQYNAVPAQLRRWVYSLGQESRGLRMRRETEVALWCGPTTTNAKDSV